MVPVTLIARRGLSVRTYGLLDTGADDCLFHANWAIKLGLDLQSGRPERRIGINPNYGIDCYIHRVDLEVGQNRVRCDVAFSQDIGDDISDQLVGRSVVFDRMRFAFRQRVEKFYIGNIP
jgi:hypothetical protein